jgi:hypothetical protein
MLWDVIEYMCGGGGGPCRGVGGLEMELTVAAML